MWRNNTTSMNLKCVTSKSWPPWLTSRNQREEKLLIECITVCDWVVWFSVLRIQSAAQTKGTQNTTKGSMPLLEMKVVMETWFKNDFSSVYKLDCAWTVWNLSLENFFELVLYYCNTTNWSWQKWLHCCMASCYTVFFGK